MDQRKERTMTDIKDTIFELRDGDLNGIVGGSADENGGGYTSCTTVFLPTPWNPNPHGTGENGWLPGGPYRTAALH
jgi:hypothetical protein